MKNLNLFAVLLLSAAMLTSGCHRKPANPTPIPGMEGPSGNASGNNGIPQSGSLSGPTEPVPVANNTGIPEGNNPIFDGPHNEDREIFKADTVYFDFDRATIKSSEESKLQHLADYFKSHPDQALIVEGNCDERGTEKYNLSLGERRALASREYLANLGMNASMIKTVTYGSSKPVDPGHNESAWSKNRRDDFVLVTRK